MQNMNNKYNAGKQLWHFQLHLLLVLKIKDEEDMLDQSVVLLKVLKLAFLWSVLSVGVGNLF